MALSLKVGNEFGNFDDLKKQIKVYITILRNILCNVLYNCYTQARVQGGGGGQGPPLEIEKQKKKKKNGHQSKF